MPRYLDPGTEGIDQRLISFRAQAESFVSFGLKTSIGLDFYLQHG
jgi:hypothetical protein